MSQRSVIKVGGAHLADPIYLDALARLIHHEQQAGQRVVLVHGGGKEISELHAKLGLPFEKKQGLRVTPPESMSLVSMVLCGLVNKRLVAHLGKRGLDAIGISGVDYQMMRADLIDEATYGRVGGAPEVTPGPLKELMDAGHLVVLAPVCLGPDHEPVNVNADVAAQALAVALEAKRLDFVTDVEAVRDEDGALNALSSAQIPGLIKTEVVSGGMIPKLQAGVAALQGGVHAVRVGSLNSLSNGGATEVSL